MRRDRQTSHSCCWIVGHGKGVRVCDHPRVLYRDKARVRLSAALSSVSLSLRSLHCSHEASGGKLLVSCVLLGNHTIELECNFLAQQEVEELGQKPQSDREVYFLVLLTQNIERKSVDKRAGSSGDRGPLRGPGAQSCLLSPRNLQATHSGPETNLVSASDL